MAWYAAHAILSARHVEGPQDGFLVWENVYLIEADGPEDAVQRAEERAEEDACPDETMTVNGRAAYWQFEGIRKVVAVSHIDEAAPSDGDEISYNEFLVEDEETLRRLASGDAVTLKYEE